MCRVQKIYVLMLEITKLPSNLGFECYTQPCSITLLLLHYLLPFILTAHTKPNSPTNNLLHNPASLPSFTILLSLHYLLPFIFTTHTEPNSHINNHLHYLTHIRANHINSY